MVRFGFGARFGFSARFGLSLGLLAFGWVTAAAAGTITAQINSDDGTAITDAVVYAVPTGAPAPLKPSKALMSQENQQFNPFVLPIQAGTAVEFPNRDSFRHHVYSFSPAKSFELKLFGGTETQIVTFDKEGVVALGCNIHDNMLAYIYVVPTPYFAKTDDRGQATLNGLPAGNYTVKVWHPNQKTGAEQPLTVAADGSAAFKAALTMKRDRKQKKPGAKDETDY